MNINNQKRYLQKIIESNSFKKAPSSASLLKFLATSTFENKDLKETTIGIELFGISYLNDSNSSRIRVSIYNLRKRIYSYYENEGRNDLYRIEIKKGQYHISFKKNNNQKIIDYKKRYIIAVSVLFFLMLASGITVAKILYRPKIVIWDSFFKSDKETILVVGDVFGVEGKNFSGKTCWYRDYRINSAEELYEYKRKNPIFKDSIYASSYTYMTGMGAVAAKDVSKLFTSHNQDVSVKLSSKIDYRDIKRQNIIYVGPLKNKNKFIDYFNQVNLKYKLSFSEAGVGLIDKSNEKQYLLSTTTDNVEYAIVSKFYNKSNGNSQFMFFSDHDIGVMATVEYFTSSKQLEYFTNEYVISENKSFIALFKVQGQERTNLGLELIVVDVN